MDKSEYIRNFLRKAENISAILQLDEKHEHNFIKCALKVAHNIYDSNLTSYVFSFEPDVEKKAGIISCGPSEKQAIFKINVYCNQPNICRTQIANSEKPKKVSPFQAVKRLSEFISKQTSA